MLLPVTHNDGRPVDPEKHKKTRDELIARFGAASLLPSTVRGVWMHKGERYEEDFIRLFVDVSDTRAHRQFFVRLKKTLLERFEQVEIIILLLIRSTFCSPFLVSACLNSQRVSKDRPARSRQPFTAATS
jgi:hypothetical protein